MHLFTVVAPGRPEAELGRVPNPGDRLTVLITSLTDLPRTRRKGLKAYLVIGIHELRQDA